MKVLVYSTMKEVRAMTGRTFDGDGKMHPTFRKFAPVGPRSPYGKAYMTAPEAKFLVESKYVRACIDMGNPAPYFYPSGFPTPVADDYDGVLTPPQTEGDFFVSDSRQVEQARELIAERDAAIAKAQAEADAANSGKGKESPTKTNDPKDES